MQKFVFICKFTESTTEEKNGEKVSKTFYLAASGKGSQFEHEMPYMYVIKKKTKVPVHFQV